MGFGSSQIAAGLDLLLEIEPTPNTKIILIIVVSIIATVSTVSGVGKGIRIISEWNIWLSMFLLAAFVVIGPITWLLSLYVTSIGDYQWNFISMGLWTANTKGNVAWQGGWTIITTMLSMGDDDPSVRKLRSVHIFL